jgi:hypothetical protein
VRRELHTIDTGDSGGYVQVGPDGTGNFVGPAADVFQGLRDETGDDDALAAGLVDEGWSNGYLYLAEPTEDQAVRAVAGHDVTPGHDELHHYWTRGPGRARWIGSDHQFYTLRDLLEKATKGRYPLEVLDQWANVWVHEVTGLWPGSDAHRVAEGHKPRGKNIGPG